jgi:hypothetical protein
MLAERTALVLGLSRVRLSLNYPSVPAFTPQEPDPL